MKLLFCHKCGDIFNLSSQLKTCSCGKVKGMYVDVVNAVVNGEGYSFAIGNGAFAKAIRTSEEFQRMTPEERKKAAYTFDQKIDERAFYILYAGIMAAWVRPHEGPANPHTKIKKDL